MQFESLKVFCDVARFRSFSQAAQSNSVTQSAASQIVLQLERRLDVQVQVAAIYSVGLGDMGKYVEMLAARQPNAKVHIEYLHPNRVYEKVLEGTADFGLVSFPRKSRELSALPWREEEMVLACPPNHPLARGKSVKPTQLEGQSYVAFDKGLVIRREVDRFLRDQGVTVKPTLEFDNIENIKKAVAVSAGVALLPKPTLRPEVDTGALMAVPLAGVRFVRPLGIIQRRHSKLSSAALRFLDILRHPSELNGEAQAHRLQPVGLSPNGLARKKKK
jgi:DNA-binding transcriptional LysR family regulator